MHELIAYTEPLQQQKLQLTLIEINQNTGLQQYTHWPGLKSEFKKHNGVTSHGTGGDRCEGNTASACPWLA